MELSKFSKQLKMLGGGILLGLAYAPILMMDLSDGKEVFSDKRNTFVSENDSVLIRHPIFRAELTDALTSGYFKKGYPACFNAENFKADGISVAKAVESEPLRFKNIESGPYKGGKLIKGTIRSNFYVDAKKLSVPVNVIDKVISSLSSKIDFRRSLRKGDQFEIAFSAKNKLIYSKIKTKKTQASVYKFGKEGYFFENGEKAGRRKGSESFAPPIRGRLHVSSPFGLRIHPVTKKYKRHSGVDLIAQHGTPVYAIYDGVVTRASRFSGYGKCVDIKHKNGYSSRYAHLSRMVVRPGARIRKGQLIAYSGATGVATGPHLHLELARNNVNLNPLGVKMIAEKPRKVSNNKQFNSLKNYFSKLSSSVK